MADGASFFISAVLLRVSLHRSSLKARHAAPPRAVRSQRCPLPERGEVVGAERPQRGLIEPAPRTRASPGSGLGADFRHGLKLFGQQRSLKLLAATVAALAFSQNMVFGLLVVYGKRTLHLSNTGYGVFLGGGVARRRYRRLLGRQVAAPVRAGPAHRGRGCPVHAQLPRPLLHPLGRPGRSSFSASRRSASPCPMSAR